MRVFFKLMLIPAFLAGGSTAAAGEDHLLRADITYGKQSYTQFLRLPRGTKADYSGTVKSSAGTEKEIILNGILEDQGKEQVLQYQLELFGENHAILAQVQVALVPGEPLPAIECGAWSVIFTLDPRKSGKIKKPGKNWNAGTSSNYRLTAELLSGQSKRKCSVASHPRAQFIVEDLISKAGKKYGFTVNSFFSREGTKPEFKLEYQIGLTSEGQGKSLSLQKEISIPLNKKTLIPGENYKLEFLLEGQPAAKGKAGNAVNPDQHKCFCIQYTGKVPPYFIGKMDSSPACEKMKYEPSGEEPTRELLACEELKRCLASPKPDECVLNAKKTKGANN